MIVDEILGKIARDAGAWPPHGTIIVVYELERERRMDAQMEENFEWGNDGIMQMFTLLVCRTSE